MVKLSDQNSNPKSIFNIIHNRRSIRKFLDKPVSENILKQIFEAGFRAPFAAQLCSLIYTRDKSKISELRQLGVYPTTQVLVLFLIDIRRLEKIMTRRGYAYDFDDTFALWLGLQDVSLVIENIIIAAEALDLGSVLLGSTPNFANQLAMMFNIPERVFPVVGLCLGFPDPTEHTEIRPRYPLRYSAYQEEYLDHTEEEIQVSMKAMDEGFLAQNYYVERNAKIPLRIGEDTIDYDEYSWCEHISRKFCQGGWSVKPLLETLREFGFKFD